MFYHDVCGRGTMCLMPCRVHTEMPRLRLLCPQPRSGEGQRGRCDASRKLTEWTSAVWLSNQKRGQRTGHEAGCEKASSKRLQTLKSRTPYFVALGSHCPRTRRSSCFSNDSGVRASGFSISIGLKLTIWTILNLAGWTVEGFLDIKWCIGSRTKVITCFVHWHSGNKS